MREATALLGQGDALLAQPVVRPRVVQRDGELPRGVEDEAGADLVRLVNAGQDHRARALVADRNGVPEHPPQPRGADAEVERRQRLDQRVSAQRDRLAPLHHGARQPLGAEHGVIDGATVGRGRLDGHEAIGVVEQVDRADLRFGEPHQRLQAAGRERPHVERLELADELRVGARPRVALREVGVRVRELGEGALAIGEGRAKARVFLEEERIHLRETEGHRPELVAPHGHGHERLETARRRERLLELPGRAGDVARDPGAADERDDDRQKEHGTGGPLGRGRRLEGDLLAAVGLIDGVVAQVEQDLAHLVGLLLALVDHARIGLVAALASADLRLADVVDPVVDEASERRDALVLHSVFGDGLRFGEHALEIPAGFLVGGQVALLAREQVTALSGLEIDHEAQELERVVGELQVVPDEPLELLLELLVRGVRPVQAHAEHRHDEQRAQ